MFRVDNEKCLRCGICTSIESDVFEFGDDGNIKINNDIINEENKDQVINAVKSCPAEALQEVKDDNTKDIEKEDN